MYAEVILPLPVEGFFTYSIPASLRDEDLFGKRVTVPLGRTKTYTAIVARCHNEKPAFEVRDIISALDDAPVIFPVQYKLWEWMADYYLSPIGEVYKAALPAGLKAEDDYRPRTETCIALSARFRSEEAVSAAFNILSRADRQRHAFDTYLELSGWRGAGSRKPQEDLREVTREELINVSRTSLPVVKAL